MIAIIVIFVLGVGNFAMQRAVLESGHPVLGQLPGYWRSLGGRGPYLLEFAILLAALLFADSGSEIAPFVYIGYSLMNGLAAWALLSGRM